MRLRAQDEYAEQGVGAGGGRMRARAQFTAGGRPRQGGGSQPDAAAPGNSLLLMQFRQFCARLLEGRDRLEWDAGVPAAAATPAQAPAQPPPAEPVSATAAAVAAAEKAIATAQAEAAEKIAAAMAKANPMAAEPAPGSVPPSPPPSPPPATAPAASPSLLEGWTGERDELRAELLALLEQQSYQAISLGGSFGLGTLRDAQYVMAVLADEVLLNANWKGKRGWRLLEEELFRSHAAGEVFFSRLDALLKMGEAGPVELAMVFYQALALDFRGKYRGNDPTHQLDRYRRQLFARIFRTAPESITSSSLTPQAYEAAADFQPVRLLADPRRWWFAISAVLLVWFVVSLLVWNGLSGEITQQLQLINGRSPRTDSYQRVP